jgi:uncharacterized membrane-anchored protein
MQLGTKTKEIMKSQVKIKVIKKNAVQICKTPVIIEKNLNQTVAREMVSTVSNWVSEFQQQRRKETKQSLTFLCSTSTNVFPQKS